MNICNRGHNEVCYEGQNCPRCECIEEKDSLKRQLEDSRENYKSLIEEFKEVQNELENAKEGLLILKGEES